MKRDRILEQELTERRRKDGWMIQNPEEWPRWPLLPLKRRDGDAHHENFCSLLFAQKAPPYKVYLDNLHFFYGRSSSKEPKTWADVLGACKTQEYATLDELLDVWTVD